MLVYIISFIGLIIGIILSKNFKNELKDIKKFLIFISLFIIFVIILKLVFIVSFNHLFFSGLIIGFIINYFIKNNYLYFGTVLMSTFLMNNSDKMFFSILIFMIGLTYPGIKEISKKEIIISLMLFVLPFILLTGLLNYNNNFILGFSIGGLLIGFKQYH